MWIAHFRLCPNWLNSANCKFGSQSDFDRDSLLSRIAIWFGPRPEPRLYRIVDGYDLNLNPTAIHICAGPRCTSEPDRDPLLSQIAMWFRPRSTSEPDHNLIQIALRFTFWVNHIRGSAVGDLSYLVVTYVIQQGGYCDHVASSIWDIVIIVG